MVLNVFKLEKELDQIFIGDMKLYVNLPKYRRSEHFQQGGAPLAEGKDKHHAHRPKGQLRGKKWRVVKGKGGNRDHPVKQSYAEVVRKQSQTSGRDQVLTLLQKFSHGCHIVQ